jgi:hypothetical protein
MGSLSNARMGLLLLGAALVSSMPVEAGKVGLCACVTSGRIPRESGTKSGQPTTPMIHLDESHNGQVVVAHPGDLIEIRLRSASGTPFSWVAGQVSGSSVISNGQSREEFPEPRLPGSASNRVVPLRAVADGATTLRFELKPPFEPTASPVQTFTVTIRVIPNRKPGRK